MSERLLAFIQSKSHRAESTILARFPSAAKALAILKRDGLVSYYDNNCSAVMITAAGRSELRRLRDAKERAA